MHSKIELNVVIGNCYLQYTNEKNYTTRNHI